MGEAHNTKVQLIHKHSMSISLCNSREQPPNSALDYLKEYLIGIQAIRGLASRRLN